MVERWGQDSLLLQKISPKGAYLESYPLIGAEFIKLFIDRKDILHLSIAVNHSFTTIMLDDNLHAIPQPVIS